MGLKSDDEYEDDGRTIVNMNVDGMPWYRADRDGQPQTPAKPGQGMSDEEVRQYKWAAVRAGLIIVLIFGAVFAAFIAFCDFIWFQ
ncbi:MAG: hypothetical protein IJV26_04465 [Lachnospiraceae bacterium]|nr:hypothetical protein [Lachnospiraceae bacterium]MBQ9643273.1 hypothetical protein [Lachnospiraceae bacterium]